MGSFGVPRGTLAEEFGFSAIARHQERSRFGWMILSLIAYNRFVMSSFGLGPSRLRLARYRSDRRSGCVLCGLLGFGCHLGCRVLSACLVRLKTQLFIRLSWPTVVRHWLCSVRHSGARRAVGPSTPPSDNCYGFRRSPSPHLCVS